MKVEGYFWFSFGGNSDIGECHRIGNNEKIDFPTEQEVGYGAALRNGMEADLNKYTKCIATVFASSPITVTAEYPANKPTYPQDIQVKSGENTISFDIPTGCTVNEVKLFISRAKNTELPKTEFKILSWELL